MNPSTSITRPLGRFLTALLLCAAPLSVWAEEKPLAAPNATAPAPAPYAVPWGISSSASSSRNRREWFPEMSAAGIRVVRQCPEWRGIQPVKGQWNWDAADGIVKAADDSNLRISGLLFGAAPGTKDSSHSFPMKNLEEWQAYAAGVAGHYKDKIRYWEVWNEGNGGFNDNHNTTADYAALAAAAYDGVKSADPTAQVGLSVASFDAAYLDQTILAQAKMGKADHFDYLCIHPYEVLENIRVPDGEVSYLWMSRMLRDALKADAPARANAEIWITEVGMPVGKNVTEDDAARAVVKSYVMAAAQGIARTMWFEGRDPRGEQAGFGLLARDGTPRAGYRAFKTMTTALGQTPKYLGWLALGKDSRGYGFVFEGAAGPVLCAWMPVGVTDNTITFAGDVQVIDSIAGTPAPLRANAPLSLTNTPAFITGLPAALVDQARANGSKNFPWGGDYSAAKTVSIELAQTTTSKGILRTGRTDQPVFQFPDGTTGLEMKNNPSTTFFVHPSFANIKTTDYYIRLTLRRTAPGNVGMNFSYEVADNKGQRGPMRHSGGWFSLGPEMGWQTKTWHVTDACFAKMWGYDFSFNPEKSVPFVIGKVEVSTAPLE